MKHAEDAGGPHPGAPAPPSVPHGGRGLTGSPDGPVGTRREEKGKLEEKKRRERMQSRTACLGVGGSG